MRLRYKTALFFLVTIVLLSGELLRAQDDGTLDPKLEVFRPFLGKVWKGVLSEPGATEQMVDVSRYERALNGTAIRAVHSVNNGDYGGESIIFWDKKKESLVFYYFTTAGFYTTGTMTAADGKFSAHEFVTGNENGVAEVKSTATIGTDGKLTTQSEYFQNGEWVKGHGAVYEEANDAVVMFK